MIYVVGLGNPGEEYAQTRHNAGRIVMALAAKNLDPKKFKFIIPEGYMNTSGKSVGKIINPPAGGKKDRENLIVLYDDLDLPIGRVKISFDRSSGGHNGLADIIKVLKSQEFLRIRIGVSPHTPGGKLKKPKGEKEVIDFLMKNFKESEMTELKKIAKHVGEALECFAVDGKDKMMSLYNL